MSDTTSSRPPGGAARGAWISAASITAASGLVIAWAFAPSRAGRWPMIAAMGAFYLVMSAITARDLARHRELGALLRPRGGDLALGAAVAAGLYFSGMATRMLLAPHGSPREGWIVRVYLMLGDPAEQSPAIGAVVFAVALLEELVWRGLVMRSIERAHGPLRALFATSVLFALAHAPTAFLLADPVAGPNPLLLVAGVGCSLVWGWLFLRTGRLAPSLFAHALFTWAVVEFPLWRP